MLYRKLGRTDIEVSAICLGTMTFSEQNTEAEAHQQLDLARDRGVNFIDCAEMYPIPPRAETQGLTETYVGSWLAARRNRAAVVLATKVVGRSDALWYRGAETRLDRKKIVAALDAACNGCGPSAWHRPGPICHRVRAQPRIRYRRDHWRHQSCAAGDRYRQRRRRAER